MAPITKPTAGQAGWNPAVDALIDKSNLYPDAPLAAAPAVAGVRAGTYEVTRSLYVPSSAAARRLRAVLAKAATAGSTALTNIACIGDSKTAGTNAGASNSWPRQLRPLLAQAGITPVGTGIVPAMLAGIDATLDTRWSKTGTWGSGTSWLVSGASGNTLTFTSDVAGTVVDVFYFNNSGAFTVSVDGGAAVAVTPTGTQTIGKYTVSGLASTTHTVVVTTSSATSTYLVGVNVYPTTGLVIHNWGIPGIVSSGWANTGFPNMGFAGVGMLPAPDAIILAVGANDTPNSITAATHKTNLTAILAAFGSPAALLVAESNTAQATQAQWGVFESNHYDVADAYPAPVLDIADRWGSTATAKSLGLIGADNLHDTAAGHFDVARAVARALV